MVQATRVLVVGGEENETLNTAITTGGYERLSADIANTNSLRNSACAPDVLIFNLYGTNTENDKVRYVDIAKEFKSKQETDQAPLILVGPSTQINDGFVQQYNWLFDEILADPESEVQIRRRINSLARLNNINQELLRRITTLQKFGIDAPIAPQPPEKIKDATILILGASKEFAIIEKALSPRATLVGALSCATALDYLSRRTFDLVIINLPEAPEDVEELCRTARRNPQLYNLPILILAEEDAPDMTSRAVAAGATGHLSKPLEIDELKNRVKGLVSEVHFRDSLREVYARARHLASSDSLTGLYSRGFMLDHLATVVNDCERSRSMFSVAFFELENIGAINDAYGYISGDRILRQVGEMMGMLVRGEDLMARYSGGKFTAILPNTAPGAAQVALNRITGVVNFTEFSFHDEPEKANISDIIRVHLSSGVTGFQGGDTPAELIDRARNICAAGG